ncbi:hypothetical protein GXB85_11530 [Cellulomonas sp. APG4]|uniref:hypothetical protein n=1 Tax=Cellulomonas sp. APG4 TaxID=1538656 RepID=UPI001379867F|nr:hypothetical protein [Cellulomonas sp. APG4]NCT91578.1 hypothetical protein [Cellulomonas sp. APG4]
MNEYTVNWPLWVPGGVAREGDLPVSEPVAVALKAWARTFNEHFDWQHGWDDPKRRDAHVAEAARLQRALQADLGDTYEVVLELWEVDVR